MSELFILFVISIPVFYVIGIISLIRSFGSSQKKGLSREDVIKELIPLLSYVSKKPDVKKELDKLIQSLKKEVRVVGPIVAEVEKTNEEEDMEYEKVPVEENETALFPEKGAEAKVVAQPDVTISDLSKAWSNWYSDNSINLLLYVGAFFIVASASIFVGFQWGTIEGIFKAIAFSLFTCAFLVCGLVFYRIPLIRTAGFTFISIAAILIPFNGVAWFNFYFGPQGFAPGGVWMITSIVSLLVYFGLTLYLQKSAFTYIASIGAFSLVLSVVNVLHMDTQYYVLGGVFTAFLLLATSYTFRINNFKLAEVSQEPLSVSSRVVLPLSLFFGFYFAIDQNILVSYPTAISLFLSALFYLWSYFVEKKVGYLIAAQFLLPFAIFIYLVSAHVPAGLTLLITQFVPFVYLFGFKHVNDKRGHYMYSANILAIMIASASVFFNGTSLGFYSLYSSLALVLICIHFLVSYFLERKVDRFVIAFILAPVALFVLLKSAGLDYRTSLLSIQVAALGLLLIADQIKNLKEESKAAYIISYAYVLATAFAGIVITFTSTPYTFGFPVLIALVGVAYFALSYYFRKQKSDFVVVLALLPVTVYFMSRFTGLSILVSLNVVQLLGILYMVASIYLKKEQRAERSLIQTVANVVLPFVALLIGLLGLSTHGTLLLPEIIFSSFIGSIYYFLSYLLSRNRMYLIIAEISFMWFVGLLLQWFGVSLMQTLYSLGILCGVYLLISYLIQKEYSEESAITAHIAMALSIVLFGVGVTVPHVGSDLFLLSLFPAIYGLAGFVMNRSLLYFGVHILFQLVASYLFVFEFIQVSAKYELLGIIYVGFAIIYYTASNILQEKGDISRAHIVGAILNAVWAIIFTVSVPKTGAIVALLIAVLSYHYHIFQKQKIGLYIGSLLTTFTLYQLLRGWSVDVYWYPLTFLFLFVVKYIIFVVFSEREFAKELRVIALTGALLVVLTFGLTSQTLTSFEQSSLISAYILTVLIAFDAWFVKEKYFGYFASAIGIVTYLWQIKFLGYQEYQMYLLPLGLYFMVLSYFTRNERNKDVSQGLEYGGLFVLLVPLLFQSFGENGFYYSLLLCIEGIVLLALGITLNKKIYRYVGIGAIVSGVFSQTYNFVFTLPRWVSTAIAGITFITIAMFLLIKRKDIQGGKKE